MSKVIKFFLAFSLLSFFVVSPVHAEEAPLTCKVRAYLVEEGYQLPYKGDRIEVVNGSTTLKPGDNILYTFDLKNNTSAERVVIQKVQVQHLLEAAEPIDEVSVHPVNGSCLTRIPDKTIFCTTNYSFVEDAHAPIEYLFKVKENINNVPKTSSLFTIQTSIGSAECASFIWLKDEKKPNPVNWSTPYASLKATDFYIRVGDKRFFGQEPIRIRSDAGQEMTTLEAEWRENGVEMRLYMYFRKNPNGEWEMYDLRTYNDQIQGDWIYYQVSSGNKVTSVSGDRNYSAQRTFIPVNGLDAEVYCQDCDINAFMLYDLPVSGYGFSLDPQLGISSDRTVTVTNNPMTEYALNVLLKDSEGNLMKDQRFITYSWSSGAPGIASVHSRPLGDGIRGCLYDIVSPCPAAQGVISGIYPGRTKIMIEARRVSDNVVIASTEFPVLVVSADGNQNNPQKCIGRGGVIKKNEVSVCCQNLVLIPPTDNRTDIYGTCLKSCYKNSDCFDNEVCAFTSNSQFVCVFRDSKDNSQIEIIKLKSDVQKLSSELQQQKVEQARTSQLINRIKDFLERIFRHLF